MQLLLGFICGFVAAVLVNYFKIHVEPHLGDRPPTYIMFDTPCKVSHLPSVTIDRNHAP